MNDILREMVNVNHDRLMRSRSVVPNPQHEETHMSWSKSAGGRPSDVKAAAEKWADEQRANDANMTAEAIEGHQAQVNRAAAAVSSVCDSLDGEDVNLEVGAWGHHNGDPRSTTGGMRIDYVAKPKPE